MSLELAKNILIIFGVVVNGVGTTFYLRELFAGKAKPNKMTFLMWSIAPLIGGIAAIVAGARWTAIPIFAAGLWPLAILIAAMFTPTAYWKLKPSDYACGALSALALVLWAITKDPNVAILFAILSDGAAALPTLVKAWSYPETEYPSGYLASSFSGLTGVIAAPSFAFAQIAFPLYLFVMMGSIGLGAIAKRGSKLKIENYADKYQTQVKDLVIKVHEEFGFPYDHIPDYDLDDPKKIYIDTGGAFYVLLENDKVVGTVAVKKIDDETADIKRMYLLPEYRGKGWGSKLLQTALMFCKKNGFKRCTLDTSKRQIAANRLYKKAGFRVERVEGNDIFMSRDLSK